MAIRRRKFNTKKVRAADDVVILDVNEEFSFKCENSIPGMVLVDFIAEMDEENPSSLGEGLRGFFEAALGANHEAFLECVRDPKNEVDISDLAEMAGWLAEQYSGENPTEPSVPSSAGSTVSGLGSMGELSETA